MARATTEPPVEGQPIVVGFVVLQHGETPAGWVTPTVHFTTHRPARPSTSSPSSDGPDGHFVATFRRIAPATGAGG